MSEGTGPEPSDGRLGDGGPGDGGPGDDGPGDDGPGDDGPGDDGPGDDGPGDGGPGDGRLGDGDGWLDDRGLITLPGGARVRGRRLDDPASPADFALVLARGPIPAWPHRLVRWPDFWVPADSDDALNALHEALGRARRGARVEVACRGGTGRTGTALAALAVLDGLTPAEALAWVRSGYHHRAVETPWQRRWLRGVQ